MEASMAADKESLILNRVAYRFIPFLILCYFVNYLDRVNVGFAKLTMDADLGLSDTAFGFGAGISSSPTFCSKCPRTSSWTGSARGSGSRALAFMGHRIRGHGFHPADRLMDGAQPRAHVLRSPLPSWRCRGRIFPRHHLLLDAFVSCRLPRPDRQLFHGGDSALVRDRLARFCRPPRPARLARLHRLAMAASSSRRSPRSSSPSPSISI